MADNQSVFIAEYNGDDYHGSGLIGAFSTKEKADTACDTHKRQNNPCECCNHQYWYCVSEKIIDDYL